MPLLLVILEVFLVVMFVRFFGFLNLFLFYVLSMCLGILMVKQLGSKFLRQFQAGQSTNANPSIISKGLLFLSGLLLIVPSIGSKLVGTVMILPPVRWAMAAVFKGFIVKRVFGANSIIHQFNKGGFNFYYQSRGPNPFQNQNINEDPSQDIIDAEFKKIEDPKLLK